MDYSQYFEVRERNNGEDFVCLKDGAPQELNDLIRNIHINYFHDCFPNDWIYSIVYGAFEYLPPEGHNEIEDYGAIEADPYHWQLRNWLNNSFAHEYCKTELEVRHDDFL